jgi:hypothetical protein
MGFLVYLASLVVKRKKRKYVGITEQRACTQDLAVKRRKEFHLDPPKGFRQAAWMKGLDPKSLQLRTVPGQTDLTLKEALLQEAIVAAQHIAADAAAARGGPWCRRNLPPADRKEVKAVCEAKSKREVLDVAKQYPEGSLAYHLAQKPWRTDKVCATGVAPLFASPPKFFAAKRSSGRHKLGVRRSSGRHKPGTARFSGKSGSQASGATRRFTKLPQVRGVRTP